MSFVASLVVDFLKPLILVVNSSTSVEYVSPVTKELLGYDPSDLLGEGWWELTRLRDQSSSDIKKEVLKYILDENYHGGASYERMLRTASGDHKWIQWNITKGPDNSVIAIGYDITRNKNIQLELEVKNKELAVKNAEVAESIHYAKRIQEAVLPDPLMISNAFSGAFVFYTPKDIVSGDLYFFYKKDKHIYVACVDCTGHGVPGALMSLIANGLLREVIVKRGLLDPSDILHALDEELIQELNKKGSDISSDGMDISLVVYNLEKHVAEYAGAMRPLWIVREGELIEYNGSRYPIGFYNDVQKKFTKNILELNIGDQLYLFSDGITDQFGGELEKKFNKRRFKELVLTASEMEISEQEAFFEYALSNWKQGLPQTDDILILGIKV